MAKADRIEIAILPTATPTASTMLLNSSRPTGVPLSCWVPAVSAHR